MEIPAEIRADLERETPAFATPAIKHAEARRDAFAAALVTAAGVARRQQPAPGVER